MLQVRPLHPLFAGEVTGVDLRRPLPEADLAAIRDAFERLSVLVFPGQDIEDAAQVAFSERFGPLEATRAGANGAGGKLIVLTNIGPDGRIAPPTDKQVLNNRANQSWHHDSSFKPVPEALALVRDLTEHATQREFVYRHAWRKHDLVMWDNRCTMHRGTDFDDLRWVRDMRRVTVSDVANSCEQEGVPVPA